MAVFYGRLTKPPYRWLPLAVFTYVVLAFLLHPLSPWRSGELADPDDIMRLVQVLNWLHAPSLAGGWYDLSQPRLSPGAGTVVHWARLLDMPLAIVMWPFSGWLGERNAALIAACVVPLVWLGLLLTLAARLARRLVGPRYASLAALPVLFAPMSLFAVSPGHAGHHGPQILVAGFGLLCLDTILTQRQGWRAAVAAAFASAAGMWLGAEGLPWLLVFLALLAGCSAWRGGVAQRNAAVFGLGLAAAAMIVLPLALPAAEWDLRALSWFSPAYVLLALLAGVVFAIGWLGGRLTRRRWLRLALIGAAGCAAAAVFAALVPAVWRGPFADYNAYDAGIALANITEAQPLLNGIRIHPGNRFTYGPALVNFIRAVLPALLALATVVHGIRRDAPRRRLWLLHGAFLTAALLLTLCWQVRVGWFMQFFAVAPLTYLLVAGWRRLGRAHPWRRLAWFVVLLPLPVLLVPAIWYDAGLTRDVLLYPAARTAKPCDPTAVATLLGGPRWAQPRTVIASANDGPELLFRTPHSVIAGNFNVPGNRDVYDFFNARDDARARPIAARWQAALVLVCRHAQPLYAGYGGERPQARAVLRPGPDGLLQLGGDRARPALSERLIGGQTPDWLVPVELPPDSGYLLFEIKN